MLKGGAEHPHRGPGVHPLRQPRAQHVPRRQPLTTRSAGRPSRRASRSPSCTRRPTATTCTSPTRTCSTSRGRPTTTSPSGSAPTLLGASLARLEIKTFFEELRRRVASMRLVPDAGRSTCPAGSCTASPRPTSSSPGSPEAGRRPACRPPGTRTWSSVARCGRQTTNVRESEGKRMAGRLEGTVRISSPEAVDRSARSTACCSRRRRHGRRERHRRLARGHRPAVQC